jgi:hypothetical protein
MAATPDSEPCAPKAGSSVMRRRTNGNTPLFRRPQARGYFCGRQSASAKAPAWTASDGQTRVVEILCPRLPVALLEEYQEASLTDA